MNLENEQLLRARMEELKIDSEKIDEFLFGFGEMNQPSLPKEEVLARILREQEIKKQIAVETDWRKLASLRAQLISLDL